MKVAPGIGLDNGVVAMGGGRVMIATVDPISVIPAFGVKVSAWLSVHLIASDYTTSGNDPEYVTFTYNFPAEMSEAERRAYVRSIGEECDALGVAIAAGHTGSYPGSGFTVIGSGTMLGFAPEGGYVTPSMARDGDVVVMTKHAAIEGTISLATSFPKFVESRAGTIAVKAAAKQARLCSTVADARIAKSVGLGAGGVSSMHDATEGGILGALQEMASASRKRFVVRPSLVPVTPETKAVCGAFGLDPLRTMGEGSLLITCDAGAVSRLRRALRHSGIETAEIGVVRQGNGLYAEQADGSERKVRASPDQYWEAYADAVRRRLG
jgi:hydrogenase expression/formation protein HypE